MASSIAQKLRLREGTTVLVVNAPSDYKKSLGAIPEGVKIIGAGKNFQQVHWFVKDKQQMENELQKVVELVKGDVIFWIFYPKGSSRIQTDLTRDKGWEKLLEKEMQWISLISFNDTWSAFGMRQKTALDKKKEASPKDRAIFDFVDPKTKAVRLPEDFGSELKKNKKQESFFNSLSFTNKKEYIEWIVTAKREETRNHRVQESIERLEKEWKNPRNM